MERASGSPGPDRFSEHSRVVWHHWRPWPAHPRGNGRVDPRKQVAGRGRHHLCAPGPCLRDDTNTDPGGQFALADPGCSLTGGDRSNGPGTGDREALPAPEEGYSLGVFSQDNGVSSHTITWRPG